MKISRMVLPIVAFCVLLSGFCNIPYISNWIFRLILLLYVVFNEKILSYAWEKRIQEYRIDMVVEGVNVYVVPFEYMKNHNALIFKGKKNNIVIEEEIYKKLSEEQLKAVCYHEVGHIHTFSKEWIMYISLVALFCNSTGLYEAIYKGKGESYLLIGISLFLLTELLKRYIEYRADRYAEKCGVDRKVLESAVRCIEVMNSGKRIIISDHPNTKHRFKRE
mgnify:CR=1 FL=1